MAFQLTRLSKRSSLWYKPLFRRAFFSLSKRKCQSLPSVCRKLSIEWKLLRFVIGAGQKELCWSMTVMWLFLRDWSLLGRNFQNQRTNGIDVLVYRKRFLRMIWRLNGEITRLTNRNRVATVDVLMKHFGWLYGSATKIKFFIWFAMRKVILRFKVKNNASNAKIKQHFVDPDTQVPTNFLMEEKCHWSAIGNRCNSPTKNGKVRTRVLKKNLAQFSIYMNNGSETDCSSEL